MVPHIIPQDNSATIHQAMLGGILTIVACVVLSLFFGRIGDIAPITSQTLATATWIVFPLTWLLLVVHEFILSPKTVYTLLEHSLSVRSINLLDKQHETLYRYDSILSVSSISGSNRKYGSIILRIAHQDDVVLHDISYPDTQSAKIKQRVNASRRHQTLL